MFAGIFALIKLAWDWAVATKIIGTITVATIAKAVAFEAAAIVLGRALAPKLSLGNMTAGNPLQLERSAMPYRRVIYGTARVSGPLTFGLVTGTKNEYLHLIIPLAGHEVDSINDVYFNDEVIAIDGSGNPTGTLAGYARIKKALGTSSQAADSDLVADAPTYWTSAHRLRGCAYVYPRLKFDQAKYPTGMPNVSAVVKGRKCYDARTATTAWTDNTALCLRDYLTNADFGLGIDSSEIDDTSFNAAADICDELVSLAAGGTEKRYRCGGVFDTSVQPAAVIEKILDTMAGTLTYVGGKWVCYAGAHRTPDTVTLDETYLRGPISVQTKFSLRDTCNRVRGTFTSPDEKYQPADITPIVNGTYLSEDGSTEIWSDLDLSWVQSHSQGQRLLKTKLESTRQDIVAELPCNLAAYRYAPGDVIKVSIDRFGWVNKLFIVVGLKFAPYGPSGNLQLGVDLVVRETAAAVWDWNNGEETTYDPAPNTNLLDARTAAAPTGFSAVSGTSTVVLQLDGTAVPRVLLGWTAASDAFVQNGGRYRIEKRLESSSDWYEVANVKGTQVAQYDIEVRGGVQFRWRIRSESLLGGISSWVEVGPHTVAGDTTAPGTPTSPGVIAYPGYNEFYWTAPTDVDRREFVVKRNTSNTLVGATTLGETGDEWWDDDTATPGVQYWYFVAAIDGSENTGSFTSGVSVTTALAPVGAAVPSAPAAATRVTAGANDTYASGDGTVFAFITMAVPALPTNAVWQNLLYRRTGAAEWLIAAQLKNTGSVNVRIDDLTPGVSYDVATQAWSGAGGSAVTDATGSPFTAPLDASVPAALTGGAISGDGVPPKKEPNSELALFGVMVSWDASTDPKFHHYEIKGVFSNLSTSVVYTWDTYNNEEAPFQRTVPYCAIYSDLVFHDGWIFIRQVNRSGVAGPWTGLGNAQNSAIYKSGVPYEKSVKPGFTGEHYAAADGAVGDGSTDDITALDALISNASAGNEILLSPGKNYRITSNWNVSKKVHLIGYGATISCGTDALDPSTFTSLVKVSADGIVLEGIELTGNYSADTKGLDKGTLVRVEGNDVKLLNCTLHDAPGCAIDAIGNRARGLVQGCTIYSVFTGMYLDDSGGNQPTYWRIANNVIRDGLATTTALSGGIKISGTGSVSSVAGHIITGNIIELPGEVGIELQTWVNDCIVNSNRIYCEGICLSFAQVARCSATGNHAQISGGGSYGYCYESAGDGTHQNQWISFTGNQAYGYNRAGSQVGSIAYSISEDQLYTTITGGVIDGFDTSGVFIQGSTGADSVSVLGVTFTRCFVPVTVANSTGWKVNGCSMDSGNGIAYCFLTLDSTDGEVANWEFTNNKLYGGTTQNCAIQFYVPGSNQIKNGLLQGNNSSWFDGGASDFFNCSGASGATYVRKIKNVDNHWDSGTGTYSKVAAVYSGVTRTTNLATRYMAWWYNRAILFYDCSGGNKTHDLPDIGDVEPGYRQTIEKSEGSGNKVTVNSAQQINGKNAAGTSVFVTSYDITTEHGLLEVEATNGYWSIIRAR